MISKSLRRHLDGHVGAEALGAEFSDLLDIGVDDGPGRPDQWRCQMLIHGDAGDIHPYLRWLYMSTVPLAPPGSGYRGRQWPAGHLY